MTEPPNDGYSVLKSFSTKEEADVAAAALRAGGISAFIGNAHLATAAWTMVQAMGGIQLMVPSAMLAEAKELLQERITSNAASANDPDDEPYDPALRKDRWKARVLALWVLGPIAVLVGAVLIKGWIRLAMRLLGQDSPE